MKLNKEWHLKHPMPKNPTVEERLNCIVHTRKIAPCHPQLPAQLVEEMKESGIKF